MMISQFLFVSSLMIFSHVYAEMPDENHHVDHDGAESSVDGDRSEETEHGYPWMTALHDKISQVASVWSSRVVITIVIIVFYDLFSPERRRRRRKELEQRRLRQEQEEQEEKDRREQQEKEKQSDQPKTDEDADKKSVRKPFQGPARKLCGDDTAGGMSDVKCSETDIKYSPSDEEHRSVQNRFLDRLEKDQKSAVDNDEKEADKNTDNDVDGTGQNNMNENSKKATRKSSSSSSSGCKTTRQRPPTLSQQQQQSKPAPPRMKATNNAHPGMGEFAYWYDVETSLFRIYTLTRKDGEQVVPPYVPHSHRGNVSIFLDVTNSTNHTINVFWVDYKGNHVKKGTIKPNHTWTQTTFIDHPWVFEDANDEQPYLYYVPYRAIPTLPTAETLSPDGETGRHKFSLVPSKPNDDYIIGVQDDIMPHPGIVQFHQPLLGITWTLTHMSRMMNPDDPSVDTLQKYLKNIMDDPSSVKYRQIRIASKNFAPIWQSPMRGLLHALGFVEVGAYAELGCQDFALSRDRVQEVALLSYMLTQWRFKPTSSTLSQPEGALDGFGRAGFGRAGTTN